MSTTSPPSFGVDSMSAPLRRVAVRRPGALLTADDRLWHYCTPIDAPAVVAAHDAFVRLLRSHGVDVLTLDAPPVADADEPTTPRDDGLADSVFTYDPSFVVPSGAVLLRPGKELRRPEVALHDAFYARVGVPVIGRIEAPGTIEGGDLCWLDGATLLVGRGFRTNQAGIDQLRAVLAPHAIDLVVFDLPWHHGPDACLHLLSVVNPLADDLALVHEPLVPVALHQFLAGRGYTLLDVPRDEFERSGGLNLNVLATGPRRGIAIDGCPQTLELMRAAGCEIDTFPGDALCVNCEGGPTCLTRPLLRT